jgi:hypothetical protein
MRNVMWLCASVAMLVIASENCLYAQGRGQGVGRSLSSLNRAASHGGGAQAAANLSRASSRAGKPNSGLNQATSNVQRASSSLSRVPELRSPPVAAASPLKNQQRIMDKRLEQAEHLRQISQKNGNERLLSTADRMEESAIRNYDRQTSLSQSEETPVDSEPSVSLNKTKRTERVNTARRGFWFQSR